MFFAIQMIFTLAAAFYLVTADGKVSTGIALKKAAGGFGFVAGMLGYYTVGNLMCQDSDSSLFQWEIRAAFSKHRVRS